MAVVAMGQAYALAIAGWWPLLGVQDVADVACEAPEVPVT